jgi:hypothetical protein
MYYLFVGNNLVSWLTSYEELPGAYIARVLGRGQLMYAREVRSATSECAEAVRAVRALV